MAELSAGVRALVGRMESNPSEFYGGAEKWQFMFDAKYREVLTEPEKGAMHEALKEVRRKEFDEKVMRELLNDGIENQLKGVGFDEIDYLSRARIKAMGANIGYDGGTDSLKDSLRKEFSTSPSLFK